MKKNIQAALIWSFAEKYLGLAVSIASTMLLARLLSPAEVGIYSLCASVAAVAGILRDFGVSEYLIQEKNLTQEKIRAAFGLAILIAWSIGLTVFMGKDLLADYFAEPGVASVLMVLSINFLILPFASPAFALLNRELAFKEIFKIELTSNVFQAAAAVTMAYQGLSYMSLAWAPVIGVLVQTILVAIARPQQSFILPSLRGAKQVLGYGSMYVSSRVIETIARNSHEFLIAKKFGFNAVGLFSRSFGFIDLLNNNLTSAIQRVATPAFAIKHRDNKPIVDPISKSTTILTAVAWPLLAYIAIMSKELISVLFGNQWLAATNITTILAIGSIPAYLSALAPNALIATGNLKLRLKVILFVCPFHIVLLLLTSSYSLEVLAGTWILSNSLGSFLYFRALKKILNTSYKSLIGDAIYSSGLLLAVVSFSIYMTHMALTQFNIGAFSSLSIAGVATTATWLLAVTVFNHPVKNEIVALIKSRKSTSQSTPS